MLKPRVSPKFYRQGNIWHVRVYVPKSVIRTVGKSEKHKSLDTEKHSVAIDRAEEWRREQFDWFNEILEQSAKEPEVVEELSDAMIAMMAREVYADYRAQIDHDLSDFLAASTEEHAANEICL